MKVRVKLKSTVTAWVEVEVPTANLDEQGAREWAADEALARQYPDVEKVLRELPDGFDYGPIELAYEELNESVQVIA